MQAIEQAISQLIATDAQELATFGQLCRRAVFKRGDLLSQPDSIPQEIFFIEKGLVRVLVIDAAGVEHTIHFALENQFIADYTNFILWQPSFYYLEALEPVEAVVLTRQAIDWGYNHMREGQKLGRLIAEYYFIYHDNRIKNTYIRSAKERYDHINEVFPNIHNRVPQHMIASYLGITSIHLSRLKKADRK